MVVNGSTVAYATVAAPEPQIVFANASARGSVMLPANSPERVTYIRFSVAIASKAITISGTSVMNAQAAIHHSPFVPNNVPEKRGPPINPALA